KLNEYAFIYSIYIHKTSIGICKKKSEILKPRTINSRDLLSVNYVNNQIFTKTKRLKKVKFNGKLPAWQDIYTWYSLLVSSNKRAFLVKEMTYIMDVSHEYERITNQKIEKIHKAFEFF